jgi:hypothetical protein
MSYPIEPEDEEFNLLYREGGGYPVDREFEPSDAFQVFSFFERSPNALRGILNEMGAQFEDGRCAYSGASGFALVPPSIAATESDRVQFKLWDERIHATVWTISKKSVTLIVNSSVDAIRARIALSKTGYTVGAIKLVAGLPKRAPTTYAATETRRATVPAASHAYLSDWI